MSEALMKLAFFALTFAIIYAASWGLSALAGFIQRRLVPQCPCGCGLSLKDAKSRFGDPA
jgi:hypothetical protein